MKTMKMKRINLKNKLLKILVFKYKLNTFINYLK